MAPGPLLCRSVSAHERHRLRRHRHRRRPRRLCRRHPRRAAWPAHRRRRAGASRRHLPQLGMHPDQGAAALGRDLPRGRRGCRFRRRRAGTADDRPQGHGRAIAQRRARAQHRRRLPAEEERRRRHLGNGQAAWRRRDRSCSARQNGPAKPRAAEGCARCGPLQGRPHRHRNRCPPARAARHGARRQEHLDLLRGHAAAGAAALAAHRRLRRHRHRVRLLLSRAGCRGDGGRAAAGDPACRGRRDRRAGAQGVREGGHSHHYRRQGR